MAPSLHLCTRRGAFPLSRCAFVNVSLNGSFVHLSIHLSMKHRVKDCEGKKKILNIHWTYQKVTYYARRRPYTSICPTLDSRFLHIEDKDSSTDDPLFPLFTIKPPDNTRNYALSRCVSETQGLYSGFHKTDESPRVSIGVGQGARHSEIQRGS